ncbi:hypothetical protein JVU11DRAFT_1102 [Chiua virens]|nr:hypothetical protein JVU11DRAFT_1102 [Chiua virens]
MDVANAMAAHATSPFMDNPCIPQLSDDNSIITLADTASLISQESQDVGTSGGNPPPTSAGPTSPSFNLYFLNSVLTAGSNIHGVTLNQGSGNPPS